MRHVLCYKNSQPLTRIWFRKVASMPSPDIPTRYPKEIVDLARVFSSPMLLGPPMGEPLLALVNHLFSPEEACVALHIPRYIPTPLEKIAKKAARDPGEIKVLLEAMAERRVIWSSERGYCLLPLIPGMFEYLLMDGRDSPWHREYARLINALCASGYQREYYRNKSPLIRNIPVDEQVAVHGKVMDEVTMSRMIEDYDRMAVLNVCQCRQSLAFAGEKCLRSSPLDGCLVFGSFADTVVERKSGRYVSKEEMRSIVRDRWEKNLVFMTANVSHAGPNAICTCCSCCCHFLESVNRFGGTSALAPPRFFAFVDEGACVSCGACVPACNTGAHTLEGGVHVFDQNRCIGCGLCVPACPTGAIRTRPNPSYKPPAKNWLALALKNLPASLVNLVVTSVARRLRRAGPGR